jgi:hypothetical protein
MMCRAPATSPHMRDAFSLPDFRLSNLNTFLLRLWRVRVASEPVHIRSFQLVSEGVKYLGGTWNKIYNDLSRATVSRPKWVQISGKFVTRL